MGLVQFGPEETGDAITALERSARREGEVGEEGDDLGLGEQRIGVGGRNALEGDAAEQVERRLGLRGSSHGVR